MRPFLFALWLAAATFGAEAGAAARDWSVSPSASKLAFVYTIDGERRRGAFAMFQGAARFDPDDIGAAELAFEIMTGSIDTGDRFGTEVVKSVDWLDVENSPKARFVLAELAPRDGGGYVATGALTLRGRTHDVSGPLTLAIAADQATAKGVMTFDRKTFGVGVGFTTLFVDVGAEISVEFDLIADPKE